MIKISEETTALPSNLRYSLVLWWVTVALGVLATVLNIFQLQANIDMGVTAFSTGSETDAEIEVLRASSAVRVYSTLAFTAVVTVVTALLIPRLAAGKNWARITIVVIGLVNALGGLSGLAALSAEITAESLITLITDILVAVVTIPAIILGFTKSANGFFAEHKRKK